MHNTDLIDSTFNNIKNRKNKTKPKNIFTSCKKLFSFSFFFLKSSSSATSGEVCSANFIVENKIPSFNNVLRE